MLSGFCLIPIFTPRLSCSAAISDILNPTRHARKAQRQTRCKARFAALPAALFRGRLSGPRGLALLTSGIALHVRLSQASCRIARTVAAQQPPQPSRGLTIRPSRRRFTATNFSCMFLLYCGRAAARLNSGVRPLKSLSSSRHGGGWFKALRGNGLELQCSDCACGVAAAISLLWFHAAFSVRSCVLWLLTLRPCWFRGSRGFVHRRSALPFPQPCRGALVLPRAACSERLLVGASGALTRLDTRVS